MNTTNLAEQSLLMSNPLVNNIIIAIAIFLLGLIIGRIVGKLVEKIFKDFKVDGAVKKTTGLKTSLEQITGTIISYAIYFIFLIIALKYVGITSLLLNVLSICIILILAISLVLTIKDNVPNIIAYNTLKKRKSIIVGDCITIDAVDGIVENISLFEVVVETKKGDVIHIPNSVFLKEKFVRKARKKGAKQAQTNGIRKTIKKNE